MPSLTLTPRKATKEIMQDLEHKGLISRLSTKNALVPNTPSGQTLGKHLYTSASEFGSHMLISVSVNRIDIKSGIGYHPDKEDFFLISSPANSKPLFLVISFLGMEELKEKITNETLQAEDFLLLDMPFCDPEVSFFTMNAGVPHGEATTSGNGACPVFYVTEPSEMPLHFFDFASYDLLLG